MVVPDILMSGHHENIRKWRLYESLKKTYERRPDLLEKYELTAEEAEMLEEIHKEKSNDIEHKSFLMLVRKLFLIVKKKIKKFLTANFYRGIILTS